MPVAASTSSSNTTIDTIETFSMISTAAALPTDKTSNVKLILPSDAKADLLAPPIRVVTPPPPPPQVSLRQLLHVDDKLLATNRTRADRPLVVGHRGALYQALENTRESFQFCADIGCDYVELDVFQIRDELIVFHGSGTDKAPGDMAGYILHGHGPITNLTYEQVLQLEFDPDYSGYPCHPDEIRSKKIPTLKQVLLDLKSSQTKVKIELKGPGTAEPTLKLVEELDMVHQCMYTSYYHDRLARIRELRPQRDTSTGEYEYPTGALFGATVPRDFIERALAVGASEIDMRYDTCTVERVNAIRKAGLQSMAWFRGPEVMFEDALGYSDVGNEDEHCYKAVIDSGVDQMCVNRPDLLLKMVRRQFK